MQNQAVNCIDTCHCFWGALLTRRCEAVPQRGQHPVRPTCPHAAPQPLAVWGNCQGSFAVSFQLVLKTCLIYISITDLDFKENLWGKSCSMMNFWLWSAATTPPSPSWKKQNCAFPQEESLRWTYCNVMHPTLVFLTQKFTKALFWGI